MPEETPVTVDQSQAEDITLEENYNNQALVLQKRVGELVIVDVVTFNTMTSIETTAKDNVKAITAHMDGPIKEAHSRHKKLTQLRNDIVSPHTDVAKAARRKCIAYSEEQKKIAAAEARKQAEILRQKEEDERIEAAKKLEDEGKTEQATQVLEAPAMPAPAIPVEPTVSVKGAREIWSAEITDPKAMFQAFGSGKATMPELTEDQLSQLCTVLKLHDLARALKSNLDAMVPGLHAAERIV